MLSFKRFIQLTEEKESVPDKPGSKPIPEGHIRLYHQTSKENAEKIKKEGIKLSSAKGIEGPRGVYSHPTGFYGNPQEHHTVEFHVPEEEYHKHFPTIQRDIHPSEILDVHHPWHKHYRYLKKSGQSEAVKKGEYDYLENDPEYSEAIKHIKKED